MERLRKFFNEETRFHDVLGGIYAITYKGKSVTARTPEKLWKKLEAERRDNCDHIEVEEGESRYGRGDNDYSSYWFCLNCGVELESN